MTFIIVVEVLVYEHQRNNSTQKSSYPRHHDCIVLHGSLRPKPCTNCLGGKKTKNTQKNKKLPHELWLRTENRLRIQDPSRSQIIHIKYSIAWVSLTYNHRSLERKRSLQDAMPYFKRLTYLWEIFSYQNNLITNTESWKCHLLIQLYKLVICSIRMNI